MDCPDRESTSAGLFPSCSAFARTNEVKSISGTSTLGNGLVKIICNSSGEGFNFQQSSRRNCGNECDAGTRLQWRSNLTWVCSGWDPNVQMAYTGAEQALSENQIRSSETNYTL